MASPALRASMMPRPRRSSPSQPRAAARRSAVPESGRRARCHAAPQAVPKTNPAGLAKVVGAGTLWSMWSATVLVGAVRRSGRSHRPAQLDALVRRIEALGYEVRQADVEMDARLLVVVWCWPALNGKPAADDARAGRRRGFAACVSGDARGRQVGGGIGQCLGTNGGRALIAADQTDARHAEAALTLLDL